MAKHYAIKHGDSYTVVPGATPDELRARFMGNVEIVPVEFKERSQQRTLTQNSALHLYFGRMAKLLNDAGFEYRAFVEIVEKNGTTVPWSDDKVKEAWKIVQEAMTGTDSTTKLTTEQVSQVYETFNRKFAELAGCSLPFPDKFGLMIEQMNNERK